MEEEGKVASWVLLPIVTASPWRNTRLIQLIHLTIGVPYPLVGFPSGSVVKNLPMQETRVGSFGWEDPLEKEMATLGNPMDRGAWQVTVHGVTKESDVT